MVLKVELKLSNEWPWSVNATQHLRAGQCLLIERAYADVTDKSVCAECHEPIVKSMLPTYRPKICPKCNAVAYCSRRCRSIHEADHAGFCEAFRSCAAYHRQLTKEQEQAAILASQCISSIFADCERTNRCGIHSLMYSRRIPAEAFNTPYDASMLDCHNAGLLGVSDLSKLNFDANSVDLRQYVDEAPITGTQDFLLLPLCGRAAPSGWSYDALRAAVSIVDAAVNWVCTCQGEWAGTLDNKVNILCVVLRLIESHALVTESMFPEFSISLLAKEPLPTVASAYHSNDEKVPLDRRRSGSINAANQCLQFRASGAAVSICPKVSLLSHSCKPNAFLYFIKRVAVVVAIRDIWEGESISLAKVTPLLPLNSRRAALKERFDVTCDCGRCATGGKFELDDINSIARDLAAIIPDRSLVKEMMEEPQLYSNLDLGMCSTRCGSVVINTVDQYHFCTNLPALSDEQPDTPETKDASLNGEDRSADPVVSTEVNVLTSLIVLLKSEISAKSYDLICNITAATLEQRLSPLSLYLYDMRKNNLTSWQTAAKQLIFLSFVCKDFELFFDRMEVLEQLGNMLKKDFQSYRVGIKNRITRRMSASNLDKPLPGLTVASHRAGSTIVAPNVNPPDLSDALKRIWREVQFGYTVLFGFTFARRANDILSELGP